MTDPARQWVLQYLKSGAAKAFSELTDADRLEVLECLGKPCSRCGSCSGDWCCYDPPYDG